MGIEMKIVSDTGPLTHLSEIGFVHFLRIFQMIHIPESAKEEYYKHKRENDEDFFELNNIKITKVHHKKVNADEIRYYNLKTLNY